jgi:putative spermidine/putrescine transport system permease protein
VSGVEAVRGGSSRTPGGALRETAGGAPVRRAQRRGAPAARRMAGAVLIAWFAVPMVPVVMWAVAARWPFPRVLPTRWGLDGWAVAWDQGAGPGALASLGLGLLVAAIAAPIGAAAAWALTSRPVRFDRLLTAVLLVPVGVPPFAVVMGLSTVSLRAGIPPFGAVVTVLVVAALPYTTYVMRAAYATYDRSVEDVARTLGAAPRTVLGVRLRLVGPALAAAAFLAFLVGWSDYVVTLVLGAGRLVTLPLLLGASASGSGNDSTTAVLALLAAAPPTVLLVLATVLSRRRARR